MTEQNATAMTMPEDHIGDANKKVSEGHRVVGAGSEAIPHHIRIDGVSAGILDIHDGGRRVNVCVFHSSAEWKEGDDVIFERGSGKTTRYRIDRIATPLEPGDQHFLCCTFAPRSAPSPNNKGQP